MMEHEDVRALLAALSEISRTLNLQTQLFALGLLEELNQWRNVPLASQASIVHILDALRQQYSYMNGGQG